MADITKRMNYFDRQFLRAKDFQDEQEYHIDRRRRHNRLLHKPGVAEGLEVTGEAGANTVTVSAGTAIDIPGREIVLAEERTVPMPKNEKWTKIYIEYSEVESDPSQDPGVEGRMRITESPTFSLVPPDAKSAYGIQLAYIKLKEGKLTTTPEDIREYAGIILRDLTTRSLTLECDNVDIDRWPKLTCSGANQVTLAGDLNVTGTLTGKLGSDMVGTDQIRDKDVTMDKLASPVRSAINAPIVSVDGVKNPGGNIDLIPANTITIDPNDATNRITIGENHSTRTNNPHGTTAAHVKALPLSGGTIGGPLVINEKVVIGKPTNEELETNPIRLHIKARTGMLPLIIEHDEKTEWTPDRLQTIFESLSNRSIIFGGPSGRRLSFLWKDEGGKIWHAELIGEELE